MSAGGEEWKERVSMFVDGELSVEDAEEVRKHLARCDSCARWLRDILALDALGRRHFQARREHRDRIMAALAMVLALGALAVVLVWWAS